jgi:hypothetical protein
MVRGSRIDSVPEIPTGLSADSIADCLFTLQLFRKQIVDSSLRRAMSAMDGRIDRQQRMNELLANLATRTDAAGNIALTAGDIALFREVGFQVRNGEIVASDLWDNQRQQYTASDTLLRRANDRWSPNAPSYERGRGPREDFDGKYVVTKDKIESFKDAMTSYIGSMSASNEVQMMSLQKLMNEANEAMQYASTLAKNLHELRMSIIRNIA